MGAFKVELTQKPQEDRKTLRFYNLYVNSGRNDPTASLEIHFYFTIVLNRKVKSIMKNSPKQTWLEVSQTFSCSFGPNGSFKLTTS